MYVCMYPTGIEFSRKMKCLTADTVRRVNMRHLAKVRADGSNRC